MSQHRKVSVPQHAPKKEENIHKISPFIQYADIGEKGKILDTRENLKILLDLYKINVQWNIMARAREVKVPDTDYFIDEEENAALADIYHLAATHGMPTKNIDKHLDSIAWLNTYHPIVRCLEEKPWDKKPRLDSFISCLKTSDDALSRKIVKRWMISAIAAAFSKEGFSTQGVLVLQGNQNIGKTRWVKSLDPIGCNAVKEGALLDPNNKDSIITLSKYWIVELGEVDATFRKSDIARLKSHITNQVDTVRLPYKEKNSRLSRRTAYVATVNESRFLTDETGNRRWWTVNVLNIDFSHQLDMQQVWAEVHHIWKHGEQEWLNDEELFLLTKLNIEHEQIDPFEEKILEYFDWCEGWKEQNTLSMTASQVLQAVGYDKPSKAQATRMGNLLIKYTGKLPQRRKHTIPRLKIQFGVHRHDTSE